MFAIVRKRNQPRHQQFATLPALDHTIGMCYVFQCRINFAIARSFNSRIIIALIDCVSGEETFVIETPHNGTLNVKAYMDYDSPEDIAQKIFGLTNIPVPYMSLFVR